MKTLNSLQTVIWNVIIHNIRSLQLTILRKDFVLHRKSNFNQFGILKVGNGKGQNFPDESPSPQRSIEYEFPNSRTVSNLIMLDPGFNVTSIKASPNCHIIQIKPINAFLLVGANCCDDDNDFSQNSVKVRLTVDIDYDEHSFENQKSTNERWLINFVSEYNASHKSESAKSLSKLLESKPGDLIDHLGEYGQIEDLYTFLDVPSALEATEISKKIDFNNPFNHNDWQDFELRISQILVKLVLSILIPKIEQIKIKRDLPSNHSNDERSLVADFAEREFYATSKPMIAVFRDIKRLADNSAVLVIGDTGVGKELVSKSLHLCSKRKDQIIVTTNVSGINDDKNLLSELFGAREKAFTNVAPHKGAIELADKGTLYLDEIGNIPIDIQQKLLRAIDQQEFKVPFEEKTTKVDFHLVTATNIDLEEAVAKDKMQSDFFSRINRARIDIPPLNERRADIYIIGKHLLSEHLKKFYGVEDVKSLQDLPDRCFDSLIFKDWSDGNVRKLKSYLENVVSSLKASYDDIDRLTPSIIKIFIENPNAENSDPFHSINSKEEIAIRALLGFYTGNGDFNLDAVDKELVAKWKDEKDADGKKIGKNSYRNLIHEALVNWGYSYNFNLQKMISILEAELEDPTPGLSKKTSVFLKKRFTAVIKESEKESKKIKLYRQSHIPSDRIQLLNQLSPYFTIISKTSS